MKLITVVTPCYNEEGNVEEVYAQVKAVFAQIDDVIYEHLFIDNCSTDSTAVLLRQLAKADRNVKIILNARNFGHIRSPYYGLLQAQGDAVILLVADLQDPPEVLPRFLEKWREGNQVVFAVRRKRFELACRVDDSDTCAFR